MKPRRLILFALLAVVAAMAIARSGSVIPTKDAIDWRTDAPAALAQVELSDQPRLLYFTASWCPPCKRMAQTTFQQQSVANMLAPYQPIKIDIDAHPAIAEKFGIRSVPTFLILAGQTAAGPTEVARAEGFMEPAFLAEWIARSRTATSPSPSPTPAPPP